MKKDYAADLSGCLNITYTINATKAIKASPWKVSRVPRGGIVFFPVGASLNKGPLPVYAVGVRHRLVLRRGDDRDQPERRQVLRRRPGWTAYAVGGNLFLKKFTDLPATRPGDGRRERSTSTRATASSSSRCRAPTRSSQAGGNLPLEHQVEDRKLPSSVTAAVGSSSLVDFALQQLAN